MSNFQITITPSARRQLAEGLPEAVAAAAYEFLTGPLSENPHRVGKRLQAPKAHLHSARRGTYRILYSIDEDARTVAVVRIEHRRDAYHL